MKKTLFSLAALVLAAQVGATNVSFNLTGSGYTQDSAVASNLFQSAGLGLSGGVVTACGGACISNPAGGYNGSISGDFLGAQYLSLEFVGVTGSATISLFDQSHTLVQTLESSGRIWEPNFNDGYNAFLYQYSGTTGIASFTADLHYDGLLEATYTNAVGAVPEPETYAMMMAGLGLLGFLARRRKSS